MDLRDKLKLIELRRHIGRNEHVYESPEPLLSVSDQELICYADGGNGSLGGVVQRAIIRNEEAGKPDKWLIYVDVYTD